MDNVRFCYNARGSLDETLSHLNAARDLGYCPITLYEELRKQMEEIRRLLNGYIAWLKAKKVGQNEPGAKLVIQEVAPEYFSDVE
jgi:hypothetical protein